VVRTWRPPPRPPRRARPGAPPLPLGVGEETLAGIAARLLGLEPRDVAGRQDARDAPRVDLGAVAAVGPTRVVPAHDAVLVAARGSAPHAGFVHVDADV